MHNCPVQRDFLMFFLWGRYLDSGCVFCSVAWSVARSIGRSVAFRANDRLSDQASDRMSNRSSKPPARTQSPGLPRLPRVPSHVAVPCDFCRCYQRFPPIAFPFLTFPFPSLSSPTLPSLPFFPPFPSLLPSCLRSYLLSFFPSFALPLRPLPCGLKLGRRNREA